MACSAANRLKANGSMRSGVRPEAKPAAHDHRAQEVRLDAVQEEESRRGTEERNARIETIADVFASL